MHAEWVSAASCSARPQRTAATNVHLGAQLSLIRARPVGLHMYFANIRALLMDDIFDRPLHSIAEPFESRSTGIVTHEALVIGSSRRVCGCKNKHKHFILIAITILPLQAIAIHTSEPLWANASEAGLLRDEMCCLLLLRATRVVQLGT